VRRQEMLSRAEILFFRGEKKVGKDYERMIRGRTTAKIRQLREELAILASDPKTRPVLEEALRDILQPENPGLTQDEQKTVREQNSVRQKLKNWRARWDLNPRSPASQGSLKPPLESFTFPVMSAQARRFPPGMELQLIAQSLEKVRLCPPLTRSLSASLPSAR
jgi:hypothetical protein